MAWIADLHIHSHWSRATSKDMNLKGLSAHAKLKGIGLLGSGDFTHPEWLAELKLSVQEEGDGLFSYEGISFMLTAEVCNIFECQGRSKRIHNLLLAPSFEAVEKINRVLSPYGNLRADGRPMLSLAAPELVRLVLEADQRCIVIPAHAWTPWYSVFGANSGFDSLEECFGEQVQHIHALETGLSSDPPMNWRCSDLDRYCLVSNSDAHSASRLGREANVFARRLSYDEILAAIKEQDQTRFLYTLEFFPQEGKYHYDGHRLCQVCCHPRESRRYQNRCPECGKKLTLGVVHRVEALSDREEGCCPPGRIGYRHVVPLREIIAEAMGVGGETKGVHEEYERLVRQIAPELELLLWVEEEELLHKAPRRIAQAIVRMRQGKVAIKPGYDGLYGKVKIFSEGSQPEQQLRLF